MTNQASQSYQQPRQIGDIDLIAEVRSLLINSGVPAEGIISFDENNHIIDALDKNPEVQRFFLNRYWNIQILNCQQFSIEERYCLIPNGEVSDWLRLFKDKVLPFIVANKLPKRI